jgi:hypothetical protein
MLKIATGYYKDLFKQESRPDIRLKTDFFSAEEKIREGENIMLESRFSEEEIKEAVFNSYADGAPGPDGLSFILLEIHKEFCKIQPLAKKVHACHLSMG